LVSTGASESIGWLAGMMFRKYTNTKGIPWKMVKRRQNKFVEEKLRSESNIGPPSPREILL